VKALRRIPPEQVGEYTLRGQYTAGAIRRQAGASYRGEEKSRRTRGPRRSWCSSCTSTIGAGRAHLFTLRHGKRLPKRVTEIAIQFKRAPQMFFPGEERLEANVLAMRIQPDEGISLRFGAKQPGPTMQLQEVDMNFLYHSSFGAVDQTDAYERLLLDAMLGDRTLFTRADEVEQAWIWAEDILEGWRRQPNNVHFYPAGTWGPAWADAFIERDGRQWRKFLGSEIGARLANSRTAHQSLRHAARAADRVQAAERQRGHGSLTRSPSASPSCVRGWIGKRAVAALPLKPPGPDPLPELRWRRLLVCSFVSSLDRAPISLPRICATGGRRAR